MAPGAWKLRVSVLPAARRGLGLLAGVSAARVVAAAGVTVAAVRWWCGLRPAIGRGAAG